MGIITHVADGSPCIRPRTVSARERAVGGKEKRQEGQVRDLDGEGLRKADAACKEIHDHCLRRVAESKKVELCSRRNAAEGNRESGHEWASGCGERE
jgi:hypothetical protein